MKLTVVADEGDVLRLSATGSVSRDDSAPLADPMRDVLGARGYSRHVVFDMGGVDFIDSSGVSWLLVCHKRFREAGHKMVLHSLQPMVHNVVKMLRLDLVFDLADHESAALEMLREPQS